MRYLWIFAVICLVGCANNEEPTVDKPDVNFRYQDVPTNTKVIEYLGNDNYLVEITIQDEKYLYIASKMPTSHGYTNVMLAPVNKVK